MSVERARDGDPSLLVVLRAREESAFATARLLQDAHERGYREGSAEEATTRRLVLLTALAGILAVTILAAGFLVWNEQTGDAAINLIYARVSPAVANIQVKSVGVTGSGVVFDRAGYVLTNYHVIKGAQNDQDIVVQLPGVGQAASTIVGYDMATDLAVLRVEAQPDRLTVANFGDSARMQVGDLAIAIGNPFGLSHSLTVGHISAVNRQLLSDDPYAPDVEGVLQTDAAINPGNSGGPLLNAGGQVIGINTRIESPSSGSVGVGFAIPSNTALRVANALVLQGGIRHPFLGVRGRPIDATLARGLGLPVEHGLLIEEIHSDSPAARIGLRAGRQRVRLAYGVQDRGGDVILSLAGQPVQSQSDLNRLIARHAVGERVTLDVVRDGRRITVAARLAERPLTTSESALSRHLRPVGGE
ncbi:MAG: S1C family serine protease [Anaerolineae bacterium]